MPGIGIITNPHSKRNKKKPETPELLGYILGEHGRLAITQSLEDLGKVAEKFLKADIDILAINGGDGTISQTISAFIRAYGDRPLPRIALLRGGTMNVLASNLGIRGKPEHILFRLCEAHSASEDFKTRSFDALKVEEQFGFLFADGISHNFLHEFYQNKKGPIGAAWLVIKIGLSALLKGELFRRIVKRQHLHISYGSKRNIECLSILAATIRKMPYGFPMFPHAKDRKMQFICYHLPPEQLLWKFPKLLLPAPEGYGKDRFSFKVERLDLQVNSGYAYSLDGELYTSSSNTISIELGRTLEFIII